jgi:hypothetical protein
MRSSLTSLFLIFPLCLSLAGIASAQSPLPKPPTAPVGSELLPAPKWADLNPGQQHALAPLASKFDLLDNAQRRKWRVVADHYEQWPADKQKTAQSRMLAWASMTAEQRAAARQQALASRASGATGEKRAQIWDQWRGLEDEERDKLHDKAVSAPPKHR